MALWETVERLDPQHDIESFRCGEASVDEWLHNSARSSSHLVATFVCLDRDGFVRAFFALRTIIVSVEGFTSRNRQGAINGQSVGILLCQMGVAVADRGQGHGAKLLRRAMEEAAQAHASSPVSLFVIDAANEPLVSYYENAGLTRVPNTLRLAMPMKAVVKGLARASGDIVTQ
jgi:ribosomal protein S18 acetylase RimI-like enzyme